MADLSPVAIDLIRRLQHGGRLSLTYDEREAWIEHRGRSQSVWPQSVRALLRRRLVRRRSRCVAVELTLEGRLVRT